MKYLFIIALISLSILFFWQERTIKKLEKQLATNENMIYQYYDSFQMVKDDYFLLCKQFDSIDIELEKLKN